MSTFFRKPEVASPYSSIIQPETKMCHRQKDRIRTEGQTEGHTDEIIYVRFFRYVCISFANFLLCKKYIAQLKKSLSKFDKNRWNFKMEAYDI